MHKYSFQSNPKYLLYFDQVAIVQFIINAKINYCHGLIMIINSSDLISINHIGLRNTIQSFESVFEEDRLLNTVRDDRRDQE